MKVRRRVSPIKFEISIHRAVNRNISVLAVRTPIKKHRKTFDQFMPKSSTLTNVFPNQNSSISM